MSCLATLVANAEERMAEAYKAVIDTIETAIFEGKSELIFNATTSHNLVSDTHIHPITANALITNGFKVVRGSSTFTVSGWDKVSLTT